MVCTFIYLQPDGSDYHALAFGTNYGGGGLQLTGQHYSHHRQHTVSHFWFHFFEILIETEFEKVHSKALSLTASSNTGLANACFLIGFKTIWVTPIYVVKTLSCTAFNPKRHGVGVDSIHWLGDCLPVLTGSYYGHKISWICPSTSHLKLFFYYLDRIFKNTAKTNRRLWFHGIENKKNINFFQLFKKKSSNFISNLNDDCSQFSFEVYFICVTQNCRFQNFWSNFFCLDPGEFGDLTRP